MPLPRDLFAPSFRRQRASSLFAVIVGFMVFAATLAVSGQALLSLLTLTWDKDMQSRMTVEIPAAEDETSSSQEERIGQILSLLKVMPGVTKVTRLGEGDVAGLIKPWIKDEKLLKALPLPTLIDVEHGDTPLSADTVHDRLTSIVRDVRVSDHASWLSDLAALKHGLVIVGGVVALLAALTLATTVSLFCRAVMSGEQSTMTLLNVIGSTDHDIIQHFQSLAMRLSWPAALIGFILATPVITLFLYFGRQMADLHGFGPMEWAILAVAAVTVPMLAVGIAGLSARLSVTNLLREMA